MFQNLLNEIVGIDDFVDLVYQFVVECVEYCYVELYDVFVVLFFEISVYVGCDFVVFGDDVGCFVVYF